MNANNKSMKNIVFTGGGTAGHITPNIALIKVLRNNFDKIYYIGSNEGMERQLTEGIVDKYFGIETVKLVRKKVLLNFKIPIKLIKGIKEAKKIIKENDIDVIFSKGGYVGLPVAIAGGMLKKRVIIHESDLTMGLSNKIASRYASEILSSFELKTRNGKTTTVGGIVNPKIITANRLKSMQKLGINTDKKVLLIMGGSQGSLAINRFVEQNIEMLAKKFYILHITGKGGTIGKPHTDYKRVEFALDMENYYAVADFCITRGGSNSLFELMSKKILTLCVPLPKGTSRGDQEQNARYFEDRKCLKIVYQKDLKSSTVNTAISYLENNANIIKENMKNQINGDALYKIAKEIIGK